MSVLAQRIQVGTCSECPFHRSYVISLSKPVRHECEHPIKKKSLLNLDQKLFNCRNRHEDCPLNTNSLMITRKE